MVFFQAQNQDIFNIAETSGGEEQFHSAKECSVTDVTSPPTLPYAPFHFAWLASEMLRRAQQHAERDWFKDRSCDRLGLADHFAWITNDWHGPRK